MVIGFQGTFDYVGTVPDGSLPWALEVQTAAERSDPSRPSLAGPKARLIIEEAGLTPNPGYHGGLFRPEVLRARVTLASTQSRPPAGSVAYFHVDRALTRALRPGDALHLSRTGCGGIGVSALRGHQLIFAIGAIRSVPLGEGVSARIPDELISDAEAVFRRHDPTFELPRVPLEISIGTHTMVVPGGGAPELTTHHVYLVREFIPGIPGIDEMVAISREGLCSSLGANASVQLLAADGLRLGEDTRS